MRHTLLWWMLIVLCLSVGAAAAAGDPLEQIRDGGRLLIGVPDGELSPFVMHDANGE